MNIKIGAIIRRLRTQNRITQDTLANAIGVTPQAISRWESEGGYPDIELLPALAEFFAVSTDELLGFRLSEREEELARLKAEMNRLAEDGSPEESLALARSANARFPADHEIRESLAVCLYQLWDENRDPALFDETESLCTSVMAECRDENIRCDAINLLILIYGQSVQPDKARDIAGQLTPMKYCREIALANGIGDGKTEFYKQDEIDKYADGIGLAIRNYVLDDELPNDSSTWDRKIGMLETANQLYFLIYGENLMFYHTRVAENYRLISTYQIAKGKTNDTLDSLEAMCRHAVVYDEAFANDHGKYYTSPLTNKLIYPEPGGEFHELTGHTGCYYLLERLQHKRYDPVRSHPRFLAVTDRLTDYAR